jgi:hypothetical protein
MKNYLFVDKVGLEVEGNWNGTPGISPFSFPLKRDVSVQRIGAHAHYGEAATPEPLQPHEVEKWLVTHWPNAAGHDSGLHCHVSVADPNLNYPRLQVRPFFDLLCANLEKWGKENIPDRNDIFWYLLGVHGECNQNRFCSRKFDPFKQMKLKDKTDNVRRLMLNYCWAMHGTVECRVWPVFAQGPKVAASSVMVWIDTVEDWLRAKDEEEKNGVTIPVRPARRRLIAPPKNRRYSVGGHIANFGEIIS